MPSTPYHFHLKDRKAFAFAGLWEQWRNPEGGEVRSCTILTTSANGVVAPVHDRMPVMLSGGDLWAWLNPAKAEEHLALLKPYPEDWMERYAVSRMVNSPALDVASLALPAGD